MGRPMSGTKLTVGQIPSEKSALVIPRQEPTMIARKATMLIPTMPATMTARILSSREGSDGVAVDTSSAYPRGRGQYPGKPDSPGERREDDMPTGKVKFYDRDKGFGFIQSDDGQEVFLPASVLPDDAVVKSGARVEFGVVEGKRGAQALSVRVLETPHLQRGDRKSADDMAVIVEDLVKILDRVGGGLRKGHYPERDFSQKVAAMLRRVADDFDG